MIDAWDGESHIEVNVHAGTEFDATMSYILEVRKIPESQTYSSLDTPEDAIIELFPEDYTDWLPAVVRDMIDSKIEYADPFSDYIEVQVAEQYVDAARSYISGSGYVVSAVFTRKKGFKEIHIDNGVGVIDISDDDLPF